MILGCCDDVRRISEVVEMFGLENDMPKGSGSLGAVVRKTGPCNWPDGALLMIDMQLVCKAGRRRWGCY